MKIDDIDKIILKYLQKDAQITSAEIASEVELSASGVQKRLRRLYESNLIKQVVAVLDREQVGYDILCFMQVHLQGHDLDEISQFNQEVLDMPEVLECHRMTGDSDYLLKVTLRDRNHLEEFMTQLSCLPSVARVRTHIVLKEVKETTALPVPE